MAIKIKSQRDNGGQCSAIIRDESVAEAFELLVVYELGYGGRVVDLTEERIVVETHIMGCIDLTTFSGPKEEMALLVKAAVVASQLDPIKMEGVSDRLIEEILEITKGIPLLLKLGSGRFVGTARVKLAMAAMANISNEQQAKAFASLAMKDQLAVVQMVYEGMDLDETLALAA